MTQSCVFEEGTVGISTIRILFRHEATTIILAVTKEAVHMLNNIVAKGMVREERFCRSNATGRRPANPTILHKGERVMRTHNLSKTQGIANGNRHCVGNYRQRHIRQVERRSIDSNDGAEL